MIIFISWFINYTRMEQSKNLYSADATGYYSTRYVGLEYDEAKFSTVLNEWGDQISK